MKILTIFLFLFLFSFLFFSQNVSVNLHQISKNKNVTLDSIYSKHLEQYRSFYVYLPKKYSRETLYPVVYTTDGQSLSDSLYFNIIDSLIEHKMIKPFIMVCVFSNEKKVENDFLDYRNYEYLKSWSNSKQIDNKNLYARGGGAGAYSAGPLFTYSRQIFVQGLGSIGSACAPYISGIV